jgi:hypothetical protein
VPARKILVRKSHAAVGRTAAPVSANIDDVRLVNDLKQLGTLADIQDAPRRVKSWQPDSFGHRLKDSP